MPTKTTTAARNARKHRNPAAAAIDESRGYKLTVRLCRGEYGTPQPTIEVEGLPLAHRRHINAAYHQIAALCERWSASTTEGWGVNIAHDGDYHGRVYLDLIGSHNPKDGRERAEAARGMDLLHDVVADLNAKVSK